MLASIKKAKIKKPSDICEPVETEECEESNGVQAYVEDVENALAKIKEMIERGE